MNTWIRKMEEASAKLPVMVTEFGGSSGPSREVPADNWLLHVMQALNNHQWSWTAWDLHPGAASGFDFRLEYTPLKTALEFT